MILFLLLIAGFFFQILVSPPIFIVEPDVQAEREATQLCEGEYGIFSVLTKINHYINIPIKVIIIVVTRD